MYEIEHSEDVHTGFNATANGWFVHYLPLCLSMGCCPDTLNCFFSQQYRWASGSTSLLVNKNFWESKLKFVQKCCYLCGMLYYSATALSIFFNPMISLLLIYLDPSRVYFFSVAFVLPSFLFNNVIMRIWSNQPYNLYVQKIRIFTYYAHLWAILDTVFKTRTMEWKITGIKHKKDKKFIQAIITLLFWSSASATLTIGGIIWRCFEYDYLNFMPTLFFCLFNTFLTIEIFTGEEYRRDPIKKIKDLFSNSKKNSTIDI